MLIRTAAHQVALFQSRNREQSPPMRIPTALCKYMLILTAKKTLREGGRWQGPTVAAVFMNKGLTIKQHGARVRHGGWRATHAHRDEIHTGRLLRDTPGEWTLTTSTRGEESQAKPNKAVGELVWGLIFTYSRTFQHHHSILPFSTLCKELQACLSETFHYMKTLLKQVRCSQTSHHSHTVNQRWPLRVLEQKERVALLNQWSPSYVWPQSESTNFINYIMSASEPVIQILE